MIARCSPAARMWGGRTIRAEFQLPHGEKRRKVDYPRLATFNGKSGIPNGGTQLYDSDVEFDADIWGTIIALSAGYDPYAAAGTLAKLSMATGDVGLASQFEVQLSSDAHKSFATSLDNIYSQLVAVCDSSSSVAALCATYKSTVHPNLPGVAPLRAEPRTTKQHR